MTKFRLPTAKEIKDFHGSRDEFRELITVKPNAYELDYQHYKEIIINALSNSRVFHPDCNFVYVAIRIISPEPLTDLLHELAQNGFIYKMISKHENRINFKISW